MALVALASMTIVWFGLRHLVGPAPTFFTPTRDVSPPRHTPQMMDAGLVAIQEPDALFATVARVDRDDRRVAGPRPAQRRRTRHALKRSPAATVQGPVPVVDADLCTGCGLCEYRCNAFYLKSGKKPWDRPAIYVINEVKDENDKRIGGERRLHTGSYIKQYETPSAQN